MTSPERSAPYGYPEWAYTPKLRELYDNLLGEGAISLLDQIGEAYILAVYNNPKYYFTRLKYQLPEGVYPKSKDPSARWENNKYINKNKSSFFEYIDNVHFNKDGEIHWDPNNPQKGMFYNDKHVLYDYRRSQTPKPKKFFR